MESRFRAEFEETSRNSSRGVLEFEQNSSRIRGIRGIQKNHNTIFCCLEDPVFSFFWSRTGDLQGKLSKTWPKHSWPCGSQACQGVFTAERSTYRQRRQHLSKSRDLTTRAFALRSLSLTKSGSSRDVCESRKTWFTLLPLRRLCSLEHPVVAFPPCPCHLLVLFWSGLALVALLCSCCGFVFLVPCLHACLGLVTFPLF